MFVETKLDREIIDIIPFNNNLYFHTGNALYLLKSLKFVLVLK